MIIHTFDFWYCLMPPKRLRRHDLPDLDHTIVPGGGKEVFMPISGTPRDGVHIVHVVRIGQLRDDFVRQPFPTRVRSARADLCKPSANTSSFKRDPTRTSNSHT